MKKKNGIFTRILSLGIAAFMLYSSVFMQGCGKQNDGNEDVTTGEPGVTGEVAEQEFVFVKDGVSVMTVVRPENDANDSASVQSAARIKNLIKGYTVKNWSEITTDWNRENDTETFEVLVGNVGYPCRKPVSDTVALGQYAIKTSGRKIIVYARTEMAMAASEEKFAALFEKYKTENADGTFTVIVPASELNVLETVNESYNSIPVGGDLIADSSSSVGSQTTVVFPKVKEAQYNEFASLLTQKGFTCSSLSDTSSSLSAIYHNTALQMNIEYAKGQRELIMTIRKVTNGKVAMYGLCVKDSVAVRTEPNESAQISSAIPALKKYDVVDVLDSPVSGWNRISDGTNEGYCKAVEVRTFFDLSSLKGYAAVIWARDIAADNDFHYGFQSWAHHYGCYFCGTNSESGVKCRNGGAYEDQLKTYCCNPFVTAAYCHGAGAVKVGWDVSKTVNCVGKNINLANDNNPVLQDPRRFRLIEKPAKITDLQAGDILLTPKHAMLYSGNGQIIDASGADDNIKNSERWNNSIRERSLGSSTWESVTKIYRYIGE